MKKISFLKQAICLGIFLMSIKASNAQVGIGVKGGLNLSKLSMKEDADSGVKNDFSMGGAYGLIFNFKVNDVFSLQPELLYSTQGSAMSASLLGLEFKLKQILNYIQVPVLGKLSFGSENVRFFINAGPYVGYMLSAKVKAEALGQENEEKVDFSDPDVKESANRLDVGVAAGLGIAFKVGPGDIFVEGRYNLGLMDINKGDQTKVTGYEAQKNRVINFSAGYIFFFGGK